MTMKQEIAEMERHTRRIHEVGRELQAEMAQLDDEETLTCEHDGCEEESVSSCEFCGQEFCGDHGTRGGDRLRGEVLTAMPSVCWECGGFDIDA